MKRLVVIGGGTAGWISALFARKKFTEDVTVISPSSIDILGAGEGSTPNMIEMFRFLEIDINDFLIKTDATLKEGINFINWNREVKGSFDHLFSFWGTEDYGFHFNARKTADYLESYAVSIGVKKLDLVISSFIEDSKGNISSIVFSDGSKLECNFIFDCSGFQRILIGNHFKSEWESYSKNLICNKAFGFFLPQTENILELTPTKTKAISMNYGWMWQIPLRNRWGCGYVFNDSFISVEEAINEVEEYIGDKIEVQKVFNFNPGVYKKTWINNCVSLGLSSGFIEPLEATSIMALIASLKKLSSFEMFERRNQDIDAYNRFVVSVSYQIVNFLVNHYKCDRTDTPFWRKISTMEIPEELKKIKSFKKLNNPDIEKAFGIDSSRGELVFGYRSYETVDYGHKIKKEKETII